MTALNRDGLSTSEFSLEDNLSLELEKNQLTRPPPDFHANLHSPSSDFSDFIHPDIPPEVLSFLKPEAPLPPPPDLTNCSKCNVDLDMIKYVCSTCGERRPLSSPGSDWMGPGGDPKGKTHAIDIHREYLYPPLYSFAIRFILDGRWQRLRNFRKLWGL
ncbi:hypothetical protein C8Q78DRAFT_1083680 [Trametes maxima]|nr:hypothetical protein C8Q78DRAFT_1083680 [Trametes maxima]